MEIEQWDGRSLGAGPIVISADWDAGQPSDWGQFLYASSGPAHHPVRVPCSGFGRFLMVHRGMMFLSRDVPAVVTPLIDLLRGHGERGTDQLVSAWTSAGSWVDVFQLLCQVVTQQARWPEKLDEAALHGVHELVGDDKTGGLEKLVVIAKGTLALCAQFKRLTALRHRGHQLLAELFGELRQWAAPLLDEASAAAVECSPRWLRTTGQNRLYRLS
ncbi:MAG: hypothetical protein J0I06_22565 [Planctomycetes bacterium]|nr:hypothetical protein [Planctomycetota bacterium]